MASTLETVADETARDALSPAVGDTLYQLDTKQVITCASLGPVVWQIYDSDAVAYTSTGENDLNYPSGLFTDVAATYYVSTQPAWHFDASILDGAAAANNPANGTAVTAWGDRSGNSQDTAQTTASLQPVFRTLPYAPYAWTGPTRPFVWSNLDRIDFDSPYTITGTGTFFAVAQRFGNYGRLFDEYLFVSLGNSGYPGVDNLESLFGTASASQYDTVGSPCLITGVRDGSNSTTGWFDGGSAAVGPVTKTTSWTLDTIGRSSSQLNIWEYIYFNTDLSLADMNVVREYLSNKYAFLSTTEIT
jgi:hypothetical protein